jgi:hypothetical protein
MRLTPLSAPTLQAFYRPIARTNQDKQIFGALEISALSLQLATPPCSSTVRACRIAEPPATLMGKDARRTSALAAQTA